VTDVQQERAGIAPLMKWVGIIAALLSLGTAVYELVHAEAELRERGRVVREEVAAGTAQQAAGDYASAWDSLALAATTAATDALYAKLFGGLDSQRRLIRTAQQDLAMEWVRRVPQGHDFAEIVDKISNVLVTGAATSTGPRKADLLAHLGLAYSLKQRSGGADLRPEVEYREALAADAANPYAHAYWGYFIMWNHGSLSDATQHFTAALASHRARADVRRSQLAALGNSDSGAIEAAWWQAVDDMHKNHETLEPWICDDMYGKYDRALYFSYRMEFMLASLPLADQLELQRMLLQTPESQQSRRWTLMAVMAITLEAAGRPDDALTEWRALQEAHTQFEPYGRFTDRVNAAIQRLGAER
jgi:hypothetical protein